MIDNYIIETSDGYGMVIDGTTCHMELNQLKKNALGGLLITTSSNPKPLQLFNQKRKETTDQRVINLEKVE